MARRSLQARHKAGLAAIIFLLVVAAFFLFTEREDSGDGLPLGDADVPNVPTAEGVI